MKVEEKESDWDESYRDVSQHKTVKPTTTLTLQEGDYTKCEKFSEWVALFVFEGSNSSFDQFWRDEFNEFNGEVKATDGINLDGILLWGKGENFLPYQEFKSRAINTFKTK